MYTFDILHRYHPEWWAFEHVSLFQIMASFWVSIRSIFFPGREVIKDSSQHFWWEVGDDGGDHYDFSNNMGQLY